MQGGGGGGGMSYVKLPLVIEAGKAYMRFIKSDQNTEKTFSENFNSSTNYVRRALNIKFKDLFSEVLKQKI